MDPITAPIVPLPTILSMVFSALFSVGLPLALFLIWRKRQGLKVVPLFVGAAAFVLFAMVLEAILHQIVLRPDANGYIAMRVENPWLFVAYGALAAGVFEETGRFVSLHLLKKRYAGPQTGLAYGIGHGGIEAALLLGLGMVSNILVSLTVNGGDPAAIAALPAGTAQALAMLPPTTILVGSMERLFAVTVHIALSIVVWRAVNKPGRAWLYPVAILLHALLDVPAALYQAGVIPSLAVVEGLIGVIAVVYGLLAWRMYRKDRAEAQ